MLKIFRGTVTLAVFIGLSALLGAAISAPPAAATDDQEIAQALRTGGFVIVLRHGATFSDQADTDPLNFDNIAAQRISTIRARCSLRNLELLCARLVFPWAG